ncbi:MAG: SDR family oxidoreductase [Bacteroidales bacterium]|nr:SDR family oxidoreductase [Bacteroidales bacterium]MCF8391742.1 SDR family oxidoreductase [Bacteroidales bacterium]
MNIIVTGASRGIGAAVCRELANSGGHHLFIISRNLKALEKLKTEILELKKQNLVSVLNFDLSNTDTFPTLISQISSATDFIDILINNAGSIIVKNFEDFTPQDIDQQFNVNYIAPAKLIQSILPLLKSAKSPHVVNISSMSGFQGSKKFKGLSHYSASKAAISSLTECLTEEFKNEIAFNALCPGAVQTEMLEEAFPGYKAPLKPKEIAEFIADFALNGHKFFNGKILPVSLSL